MPSNNSKTMEIVILFGSNSKGVEEDLEQSSRPRAAGLRLSYSNASICAHQNKQA